MADYNSSLAEPAPLLPPPGPRLHISVASLETSTGLGTAASAAHTARLATDAGLLPASVVGLTDGVAEKKVPEMRRRRRRAAKGENDASKG